MELNKEALKHLDSWDTYKSGKDIVMWALDARIIISKLVAELDKKAKPLPLTDKEAMDIWLHLAKNYDSGSFATFFVREIEKRHGIK